MKKRLKKDDRSNELDVLAEQLSSAPKETPCKHRQQNIRIIRGKMWQMCCARGCSFKVRVR